MISYMYLFRLNIMDIDIALIRITSSNLLCKQSMIIIQKTLTSKVLINKIRKYLKVCILCDRAGKQPQDTWCFTLVIILVDAVSLRSREDHTTRRKMMQTSRAGRGRSE